MFLVLFVILVENRINCIKAHIQTHALFIFLAEKGNSEIGCINSAFTQEFCEAERN